VSDSTLAALAWALSGVSLAGGFLVLFPWFQRALDHRVFAEQIRKLLMAGNADRARKLCGAAPRSPVAVALGLTLESYAKSKGLGGAELVQRLREIYMGSFTAMMRGANRVLSLGAVVLACGSVVTYLVAAKGASVIALGGAIVGLFLLFAAFRMARKLTIEGPAVGDALIGLMAETRDSNVR
jgi:hypothetical protein